MNRREAILAGIAALLGAPVVAEAKPGRILRGCQRVSKTISPLMRQRIFQAVLKRDGIIKRSKDAGVA
jgi:hypothetical protein